MNLLLDTNILMYLAKDRDDRLLTQVINPDKKKVYISVTSIGELRSIGLQNNWGEKKWRIINSIIDEAIIIEVNESLIDTYAEIDAFSQRKNPTILTILSQRPEIWGRMTFG